MNPDIIDALIGMFNDFSQNEQTECLITSSDAIQEILLESGFSANEISLAVSWLEAFALGNTDQEFVKLPRINSVRILSPEEHKYLSPEAIGYLKKKYQKNALTNEQLEFILDQVSIIGKDGLDIEIISWIYHMTRLNFQENERISDNEANEKDPFNYLPTYINENYLHYIH